MEVRMVDSIAASVNYMEAKKKVILTSEGARLETHEISFYALA
jgi:hypothetical protein